MTGDLPEIPLRGGRITQGIVRVGDTVRRPANASSPFVRRLLRHLSAKGFSGAPAFLGIDERNRDILTFIAGEVPPDLGHHDDDTLRAAASLIRRFHDASAGLVTGDATEVVCHNDLSPCNCVFRAGLPVALIDFDAAAPGTRAHDLGYAAWLWLDLGSPDIGPEEQGRRLTLFLDAYGTPERQQVLGAMLARQAALADEGRRAGNDAMAEWAAACLAWTRRNARLMFT